MQGVLGFAAIQREVLSAASKKHGAIRRIVKTIFGAQGGVLDPRAIREIGRRQQPDRLLPVTSQRLLRQIIGMDRRRALEFQPLL